MGGGMRCRPTTSAGAAIAPLRLNEDGAELRSGAARALIAELTSIGAVLADGRPGERISGHPALQSIAAADTCIGVIAADLLGPATRPVRATFFDKSPAANWSLAWHQDRTIGVRERRDTPGFGPWTVKKGMIHVAPPTRVLERMLTLRVHLDDVASDNGPLLVALGSHRHGRVAEQDIARVVERCAIHACLAEAGDVWVYATLILHASDAAVQPAHRRVLQIDYAADPLPGGLEWAGL